jgi:filamentous hemagglutinin
LQAGDNLLLSAGRDVNLTAALVDSNDGAVSVAAGRDVNLLSANETHDYSLDSYDKKKKTLSSTTTTRSVDAATAMPSARRSRASASTSPLAAI